MKIFQEERYRKTVASEISSLPGIGVKRAEAFRRLGVYTVGDLLRHFPRAYQNRGNLRLLSEGVEGESCSYLLTVGTQPRSATLKNRKTITKFRAFDESGTVEIVYFNSRFLESVFTVGETYRFWGKLNRVKSRLTMAVPLHEYCPEEPERLPPFTPVYPAAAGLTQGLISETVGLALERIAACGLPETVPEALRREGELPDAETALRQIHRPTDRESLERARRYFATEDTYLFALALAATRQRKRIGEPPRMEAVELSPLTDRFGFPLTGAQKRSIDEIVGDMVRGEAPMSRLLSGDVGSGKTAVAAAALFLALANGYQAALMAPTEILAAQHYETLAPLLAPLGYEVKLLLGSTPAAAKRQARREAEEGTVDLLIGTHSLLTEDTAFARLGLVITDEQHRFGVAQRAGLGRVNREGKTPHVLVMSATPIPRTLALILYGELSLSVLDEMPAGRQRVDTFAVDESYRARLNGFIAKQVAEGGQVYIVCPAVEPKEEELEGDLLQVLPDGRMEMRFDRPALTSAVAYREHLATEVFPDLEIGLLHGRMKGSEKEAVMARFAKGEIPVLVSTTVIEVGVNVPNASLMIVENAERFGLAQLHQLRGRVGRGRRKAYCVLVSGGGGETAEKRLSVMKNTYDGFRIAEYDLELRGPGDYFPGRGGTARQHGSFGGSPLAADMPMLKRAMAEAEATLATDPALQREENRFAAESLQTRALTDERAMQ